jgi:hypothetical protein
MTSIEIPVKPIISAVIVIVAPFFNRDTCPPVRTKYTFVDEVYQQRSASSIEVL